MSKKQQKLIIASIFILTAVSLTQLNIPLKAMSFVSKSPSLTAKRSPEEETRIELYKKASLGVVAIHAGNALGSGFIVSSDGLIVTNAHVLSAAEGKPVTVILSDGREVIADVIGFAGDKVDLAAAKIRGEKNLPALKLAPPNSVEVGQTVYAIGTPRSEENRNSLTQGIVSGIRDKGALIQHDAPINPGNSGGPLLNSDGDVIGVNQKIALAAVQDSNGKVIGSSVGSIGINFAISIHTASPFMVALQDGNLPKVAQQPSEKSESKLTIPILPTDGQMITNRLKSGDSTWPNKSYFHAYAFKGKAGQQVMIEVDSKQIDPSLILILPEKENNKVIAANDDISPENFNARIETTLPKDGTYVVVTSSFESGETGEYQIRATLK